MQQQVLEHYLDKMVKYDSEKRYEFIDLLGGLPGGHYLGGKLPLAEVKFILPETIKGIKIRGSGVFEGLIHWNMFGQPKFFYGETPEELKEGMLVYLKERKEIPSFEILSQYLEGRTFKEAEEHYQTLQNKSEENK